MRRIGLIFSLSLLAACSPGSGKPGQGFCSVGTEELNSAFDNWSVLAQKKGIPRLIYEGRGNLTAPRTLLDGRCDMAGMSMPMADPEVDAVRRKYGALPVAIPVAADALAVVVHSSAREAPLSSADLQTIFHSAPGVWPEGLPARGNLRALGLNSASDLYRFFKEKALSGKPFSDRVVEMSGPLTLVEKIAETPGAVGYARPAQAGQTVRILPLRDEHGTHLPDQGSVQSGRYPLSRFLYVYLRPDRVHPDTLRFLELVLSSEGQAVLTHLGLYPLSDKDREAALRALRKQRTSD